MESKEELPRPGISVWRVVIPFFNVTELYTSVINSIIRMKSNLYAMLVKSTYYLSSLLLSLSLTYVQVIRS